MKYPIHSILRACLVGSVLLAGTTSFTSCSKKSGGKSSDAPAPVANPVPALPPIAGSEVEQGELTALDVKKALAVTILNLDEIQGKSFEEGREIEIRFARASSDPRISNVVLKCKLGSLENSKSQVGGESDCAQQVVLKPKTGTYQFSVSAAQVGTIQRGEAAIVSFSVGEEFSDDSVDGRDNDEGSFGNPGSHTGSDVMNEIQVGDMFSLNMPKGFHLVHSASTFTEPGQLYLTFINGGRAVDSASPFIKRCDDRSQSEYVERLTMSSGRSLDYCVSNPSINFSAPADPIFNEYRWINRLMSYNSVTIASDSTLKSRSSSNVYGPSMAKMSVNVFSNPSGQIRSQEDHIFATEMSQTSSILTTSCFGQMIQPLGNAAIFQGIFNGQLGGAPLFGCTVIKNNAAYVYVGAFLTEVQLPLTGTVSFDQFFTPAIASARGAEVVVEIGPYPRNAAPIVQTVASDAQGLMVANLKKIMPSANQWGCGQTNQPCGGQGPIVNQPHLPGGQNPVILPSEPCRENCSPRPRRWWAPWRR